MLKKLTCSLFLFSCSVTLSVGCGASKGTEEPKQYAPLPGPDLKPEAGGAGGDTPPPLKAKK